MNPPDFEIGDTVRWYKTGRIGRVIGRFSLGNLWRYQLEGFSGELEEWALYPVTETPIQVFIRELNED